MIYPNKPLYLLSLLGYIYYLTYYTLTTKDNISITLLNFSLSYKCVFTPLTKTVSLPVSHIWSVRYRFQYMEEKSLPTGPFRYQAMPSALQPSP